MSEADQCRKCGTTRRPTNLEARNILKLGRNGSYCDTRIWFCSDECYEKLLREYISMVDGYYSDTKEGKPHFDALEEAYPDYSVEEMMQTAQGKQLKRFTREWFIDEASGTLDRIIMNEDKRIESVERHFEKEDKERERLAEQERKECERKEKEERRELERKQDKEERRARDEERDQQREQDREERRLKEERREYDKWQEQENKRLDAEEEQRRQEQEWQETIKPKPIPDEVRYEHTHILGPSGSGKTTLLQNNLLQDFLVDGKINPEPPAYIVIDPKGSMIERLAKLRVFDGQYKDRIVIIDPFDSPALNLFQTMGRDPAQLISDFRYIFSTTNQKMTGKQVPCFSYCAQLLFKVPNANLFTLLDLLEDRTNKRPPNPVFQQVIPKLPPVPRRFFESDFYSDSYRSTREEVKVRIWGVLENDTLSKMFNANTRKLDIANCIRERKILLVNTRMTQLKEAHQILGRYIIALAKDAIVSRTEKHPIYLVIDEFQEFADPLKTPELLRLIREGNGGAVLAHQNIFCAELDDDTRSAISTNTSIKYASSPEGRDLPYMARDLWCEEDFLKEQHKSKTHAQFACFVRGIEPPLKHPFIVKSELGWIEKWPKMSDADYDALRARNKAALQDDDVKMLPSPEKQKTPHILGEASSRPTDDAAGVVTRIHGQGHQQGRPEADKTILPQPKRDPALRQKWTPPTT